MESEFFKNLFETQFERLCRISFRIVRDAETAKEVVQDVFVAYWEMKEKWPTIESPEAFITRMVYNRSINYKTRSKDLRNIDVLESGLKLPFQIDPESILQASQIEIVIAKVIEALPEKCRIIFLMSREDGKAYKEIAFTLGISVKTVEAQMGVALKRLRTALEEAGNAPTKIIFIFF